MPLETQWSQVGKVLITRPSGHLVGDVARAWFDELKTRLGGDASNLIVDFRNVESFSSEALGELLFLTKDIREQGGDLKILNLCPFASEVFQATRLLSIFEIFNDEQTALVSFPPEL